MARKGCMTCVKYFIMLFNLVFVVGGFIMVVAGIIVDAKGVTIFMDMGYVSMPVIVILLGCFVFALSLLGCCGAMREIQWKLSLYGVLLFVIFAFQVAGIVLAYLYHKQTYAMVKHGMKRSLSQQKRDELGVWDRMQSGWKCCGVDGPKDYPADTVAIPASCCKPGTTGGCSKGKAFQKGCYKDLVDFINYKVNVFGGLGGTLAVSEIIGVVLTFYLVWAIRSENKARMQATPPQETESQG